MMELSKQFILITGASSGIGRSIAITLSDSYNLVLLGRNIRNLEKTKSLCNPSLEQIVLQLDLALLHNIEKEISELICTRNINIIHLIHCAGLMKLIPLKMLTIEHLYSIFSVNSFSVPIIIKSLINKKVNDNVFQSAILISSNISNFGAKAFSIYGASKASLDGFMRNLAVELAPKVRINSILPGSIRTEMTEAIFSDEALISRMESTYPLGLGQTSDISGFVQFLLSEKARWITGQQFTIDGGRTINISG